MLSAAIIFAIALAIFLGYKTKINTGLFCICVYYRMLCNGIKAKAGHRLLADQHHVRDLVGVPVL